MRKGYSYGFTLVRVHTVVLVSTEETYIVQREFVHNSQQTLPHKEFNDRVLESSTEQSNFSNDESFGMKGEDTLFPIRRS